jgi:glycosyltransferase involved in cell wall biosynthesis
LESTGGYSVFLDADDRLLPCALEAGLNAHATHPECPIVFGRCRLIDTDGSDLNRVQPFSPTVQYREMLSKNYIINPGSVMYRTDIFCAVGGFDETISPTADFELYLRIGRKHPIFAHPAEVVEYRMHPANMSNDVTLMLRALMKVYKAQKPYVSGDPAYTAAFEEGTRKYLDLYYYANIRELQSRLAGHHWFAALSTARVLSRYYPKEVLGGLIRTLYRVARRDGTAKG